MKGIVFKEFISMVESLFGDQMVEDIIEASDLKSEGAYTSVGTYDHGEILQLVTHLSSKVQKPTPFLVRTFGRYLAPIFRKSFPDFFKQPDLFSFLKSVDSIIHIEVKKLYPDAELPSFTYEQPNENTLIMNYSSNRPFADLAHGLLDGAIESFNETVEVSTSDATASDKKSRQFIIKRC